MPHAEIELLVDANAKIGEAPSWSPDQQALFWIDVKAPALYRTDFDSLKTRSWPLPSDIGGYALTPDGKRAILGLRTGVFALDFDTGGLEKLCDAPFDSLTHRFNEGDCDPAGRLWLGTMFDPLPDAPRQPVKGHLYSFTLAGGLVEHADTCLLHNGFAWTADGSEVFIAHSYEGKIYAYTFDGAKGKLGSRRIFAEIPKDLGIPDGGAFDAEGFYWSAIHQGGCLHRYSPDGQLDRVVRTPIQNPTMVAFCGPDLRDLCFTSANHGEQGKPHEGGIFRMRVDVAGLPRPTNVI